MSLTTATLAGHIVTSARVSLPAWGAWYADATADGEFSLTGAVTLVVADLTLKGTILSGGAAKGRSFFRIVGGAGGWGKALPRKSYANDAGVKLATVLGDAAKEAGETLDMSTVDTQARLGPAWTRPGGRPEDIAAHVLELVASRAWYVGEDGKTRLGRRPTTNLADSVPRTSQVDLARGTVELAPESIANILPGITVGTLQAVDVEHEIASKSGLRTTIWGHGFSTTSRRLSALRAIYDQLDPGRAFRGVTEYRIVTKEGERFNLQPVRTVTGMPDLRRVPVRPGLPGCKGTPALGSRVLVGFVDSDPARPYVSGFEDADGEGFLPTGLDLVGGSAGVARVGDHVTITQAQLAAAGANVSGTPVSLSGNIVATISSGSSKVTCG